jgi:hypothetical protein
MALKINLTATLKIAHCPGFFKIAAFLKFIFFFWVVTSCTWVEKLRRKLLFPNSTSHFNGALYPPSYEPEISQKKFCYTEVVVLNMKAMSGVPETSVPPTKLHHVTSHKSVPVDLTVVGN